MSDEIKDYPGKGNPVVDNAIKDGSWKLKMDKSSNKPFFYNPTTKKTTWDLAKELGSTANARPKSPVKNAAGTTETKKTFGAKKDTPTATPAAAETTAPAASSSQPQQQQQQQPPQNYNPVSLSDPIQRLLEHNKKLVTDIASHEAESIKAGMASFESRLDLLVHANNVLAVQLDRRNQEANALQHALTESHDTIHKLKNEVKNADEARSLTNYAKTSLMSSDGQMKVSNDEAKRSIAIALETVGKTVVHLQEQNRSLSATISALTSQLIQNVQSSSASRGVDQVSDQPHEWWKNSKGYSVAALTSRFLDSPARNALCPKCSLRIADFRDQLLREVPMGDAEKQAHERAQKEDYSPIAARTNLQPAGTPVAGGQTNNNYQRQQPAYVSVNNVYNQNNQLAGGNMRDNNNSVNRGGAFNQVANQQNSSVARRDSPMNVNSTTPGSSSAIRPGALFGGR